MIHQEELIQKIAKLPSPLIPMVDTFVDFLLARSQQNNSSQNNNSKNDLDAGSMTRITANGQAFDWLAAPAEDGIYSDNDGELL